MNLKCIYPYFTQWLVLTTCNSLYIINKKETKSVCKFEEEILKIANINFSSCCVYTTSGYYYVNLESYACIKKENKNEKLKHIGTLNNCWDIYKDTNNPCILAYNTKTNKHSVISHKKKTWVIKVEGEQLTLIEADSHGLYIKGSLYKFPNEINVIVKKLLQTETNIVTHAMHNNTDILIVFCMKYLTYFPIYNTQSLNDLHILNNTLVLFHEYYFTLLNALDNIKMFTYDVLLSINVSSIIYTEDNVLHLLNTESQNIVKYEIDYNIKDICENENKNLLIVKDDNSIVFV